MADRDLLRRLDKETLIDMLEDQAKNWLAHDGLWFQAVENAFDMETAIQLDREVWIVFTQIEAKRIMRRHDIDPNQGLSGLEKALAYRMYARINTQSAYYVDENSLRFEMNDCRVQSARKRKNLPDFPCKPVGIAEYAYFAHTVDSRIRTEVIACPPDPHPDEYYCAWLFTLEEDPIAPEEVLPEG
ncbi:MAG: DUF6125 family protein [Anaerolineales bacterium]